MHRWIDVRDEKPEPGVLVLGWYGEKWDPRFVVWGDIGDWPPRRTDRGQRHRAGKRVAT